jgi:AraC-like DNA-binding protein
MVAMVQAQSLRGYRELVGDLGGNSTRLLRRAGVDPSALNQLTAFIGFDVLADLLESSAAELGCPDFGLRLSERQDIGILDTLAVAIRYSATVGEAAECASRYLPVYTGGLDFTVGLGEPPGSARLEFSLLSGPNLRWAQTAEHALGLTWRIVTLLSEGRGHLQGVWFPHPAVAPLESYQARFDAPLNFASERAGLAIAAKDLDLPIRENNQELHDLATRYLDRHVARGQAAFTVQVRQAVDALLGTGTCSHNEVARALHMHPRSLQRQLRQEGTTFEAIKDDARKDRAQQYLSQPEISLRQVTALLDYTEQSALGRSCRRWFHTTPRAVRARLSSAAQVSPSGEIVAQEATAPA